jgi:hypothetical protein
VWRQALPVDPSLGEYPEASQVRPALFTRFVPVAGRDGQLPPIQTTSVSETPLMPLGRAGQALKRLVFGPPLDVSAIAVERMRKLVALPVLSTDALSSVAYGPQAMLAVLVLAGLPGLSYSLPVGAAIVFLMLAVGVSYRQTIRAYPQGGGSYIVASEELGRVPGLMAAAGLLIDYIMTVAVSIASGVAAITSPADTIRRRFLGGRPQVTPGLLDYLTTVDYTSRLALLAVGGVPAPDQCQPHVTNGRRTTATASSPWIRRYPMIHSPAPASAPPTAGCGPSAAGRTFPDATGAPTGGGRCRGASARSCPGHDQPYHGEAPDGQRPGE